MRFSSKTQDVINGTFMPPLKFKNETAFRLYQDGKSFPEISEMLGIPIGTLRCWSHREKWSNPDVARCYNSEIEQKKREVEKNLYDKLSEKAETITMAFMESVAVSLHIAAFALKEVFEEGKGKKTYRQYIKEVNHIMRLLRSAADIQSTVLPSFSRDMAEEIVDQISDLRDQIALQEEARRKLKAM